MLIISTTGISAVEVVITITSRQINVLCLYTITITQIILRGYIQFQNMQQKYYTLYFFCPLTKTPTTTSKPPKIKDYSTLMNLYSTIVLTSL